METSAKVDKVEKVDKGVAEVKTKNLCNRMEWAGAFGDVGTLIPFVVAYITIVKIPPLGLLFMFGITLMVSGLYYRTPLPIQPMKAIGAAAIAGGISPAAVYGAGLITGLFWLLAGLTGIIRPIARLATKPVVRGMMLGLGLTFMVDGINRMKTAPVLAGCALVITYILLTNPKIPAMFVFLSIGVVSAVVMNPEFMSELAKIHIGFKLPVLSIPMISLNDLVTGTLLFTIPQIPLTLDNAVIAIVAENNQLFPDRIGHRGEDRRISRDHEPGFAPFRRHPHVSRSWRNGRACSLWSQDGRRSRHSRKHAHPHRPVFQRFRLHHLQDLPQFDSGRHPVLRRLGARHGRQRHWRQKSGFLRDAHRGSLCHVEHGGGFSRGGDTRQLPQEEMAQVIKTR